MAFEDELAAFNASVGSGTTVAEDDFDAQLAAFNSSNTYSPPLPVSYEQEFRRERLGHIRAKAAAGEEVDFKSLPGRRPGQQLTIGGVPAEQTNYTRLTLPERVMFSGMAGIGAAIENPILRLMGRGEQADKNTRALTALNSYGRELAKNSVFGETLGPMVHDVGSALAEGTLASAAAPVRGGTASLAALSTAFGVNGYDKAYVEAKDMGLPEGEAGKAGARQFLIDGALTFLGGKAVAAAGLNPGRYFGPVLGRAAQKAAEHSGLSQVLGSAMADAGVNGIQGGLTYLNEAYTGVHEFDADDFTSAMGMSAAVGGVAGAATSGVQTAFQRFKTEVPKAVAGAKAANDFAAAAKPEQIKQALAAESPGDFTAATGEKGKGPTYRESFQEELESLVELQTELEARDATANRSLDAEQLALAKRREALATAETEFSEMNAELKGIEAEFADKPNVRPVRPRAAKPSLQADPGPFPLESVSASHALPGSDVDATAAQLRASTGESTRSFSASRREVVGLRQGLDERKVAIEAERKAIAEAQSQLHRKLRSVEGEIGQHRAYLESELDRIVAAEQSAEKAPGSRKAAPTPDDSGLLPPERPRTPKKMSQRYDEIDTARSAMAAVRNATFKGELPDAATRRDIGKLIDAHVEGQDRRVRLFNSLANAKTPGQVRTAMESLGKHMEASELRVARDDFAEAVRLAKNLRPEFQQKVDEAKASVPKGPAVVDPDMGVPRVTVDGLRDAAEAIRTATYESAVQDEFIATQRAQGIADTSAQIVGEIDQVRPYTMQSDDPVRRALGQDEPGRKTERGLLTLDSPVLREWGVRPENEIGRMSETLRQTVYEPIAVEGTKNYYAARNEAVQGLGSLFDSLGLEHGETLDATLKNIGTRGGGTELNRWRNEKQRIDGVTMTRGEAVGLVLLGMDDSNAQVMRDGGFDFRDGRTYAKMPDRVWNQLLDFIGPEGQQVVDWEFRYLNGPNIDRVNDAHQQATGRPLTTHKNRVPRNVNETWDIAGDDPLSAIHDHTVSSYRHLKHREDTAGPLTWPKGSDGISYFMNHVDRFASYAAYRNPVRDAQAVLNNPDVTQAIKKTVGDTGLENIKAAIKAHVVGTPPVEGLVSPMIARLNGAVGAAMTSGKASVMFLQPLGALTAAAYRPNGLDAYVKGLAKLGDSGRAAYIDGLLNEYSPVYRDRFTLGNYTSHNTGGLYRARDWFRPPTLADQAARPVKESERVTSARLNAEGAIAMAEAEGLQPGTREFGEYVAREWERGLYRGENTSNGMEGNAVIRAGRGNPIAGMFALFQSAASKVYSMGHMALDKMDAGKYKEALSVASIFGTSVMMEAMLRAALSLSKEDKEKGFFEAVEDKAVSGLASLHPLGSQTAETVARAAQGLRVYEQAPASVQPVQDFAQAVGQFAALLAARGEEAPDLRSYVEGLWKMAAPVATMKGLPVAALDDYRKRLVRDKENTEQPWDEVVSYFTQGEK